MTVVSVTMIESYTVASAWSSAGTAGLVNELIMVTKYLFLPSSFLLASAAVNRNNGFA